MTKKVMKVGGDFAESAYDAAATFGRVVAFIKMLVGILIGVVLSIIGIVLIRKKKVYTQETAATVLEPKCQTHTTTNNNRSTTQTQCAATLQYSVNSKEYKTNLVLQGSFAEGQKITIQYNPDNPSEIREPQATDKTVGIILILVGLTIMVGTIVWFVLTLKYKVVAAGTGAYEAVDMVFNTRPSYF